MASFFLRSLLLVVLFVLLFVLLLRVWFFCSRSFCRRANSGLAPPKTLRIAARFALFGCLCPGLVVMVSWCCGVVDLGAECMSSASTSKLRVLLYAGFIFLYSSELFRSPCFFIIVGVPKFFRSPLLCKT